MELHKILILQSISGVSAVVRSPFTTSMEGRVLAYHLSRLQYSSQLSNFGKKWAFRSNICDASVTPSGVKLEWYVSMYVFNTNGIIIINNNNKFQYSRQLSNLN
jgi:hypothetical protein